MFWAASKSRSRENKSCHATVARAQKVVPRHAMLIPAVLLKQTQNAAQRKQTKCVCEGRNMPIHSMWAISNFLTEPVRNQLFCVLKTTYAIHMHQNHWKTIRRVQKTRHAKKNNLSFNAPKMFDPIAFLCDAPNVTYSDVWAHKRVFWKCVTASR